MASYKIHILVAIFTHKSSVTVIELRDYITRRKKKKISIFERCKNGCTLTRIPIEICNFFPDLHKNNSDKLLNQRRLYTNIQNFQFLNQ